MKRFLTWAPRILGILFAVFTSIFSFDVFEGPAPIWEKMLAFLIHLIPVFILAAGIWFGWKRPLIGGIIFIGFSAWYLGLFMPARETTMVMILFGAFPAGLGLLYIADWLEKRQAPKPPAPSIARP